MTESTTVGVLVLAVGDSQRPAGAVWRRGCAVPTFCDFKMLRLQELKMQTFCESRILESDDLMIQ